MQAACSTSVLPSTNRMRRPWAFNLNLRGHALWISSRILHYAMLFLQAKIECFGHVAPVNIDELVLLTTAFFAFLTTFEEPIVANRVIALSGLAIFLPH